MKDSTLNLQVLPEMSAIYQAWYNNIAQTLVLYRLRYRTRHQLTKLSIEQLRDVGISPEQAQQEANKAFWED